LCGIAGIWNADGAKAGHEKTVGEMVQCLKHRGPNAHGLNAAGSATLGHTRLSIIDLDERANQPMADPSGRFWLVFNGEIYNFKMLAAELRKEFSVEFKTTSDTEVLLYGLIHYGADFIPKLNGFFAFGFYDREKDELLIARDRYGIKPLYYHLKDREAVFASSLQAVMKAMPAPEIDPQSLASYLQFSYVPAPNSMIKGVEKLMPGTCLSIKAGTREYNKYYSPPATDLKKEGESEVETFRSLIEQSVKMRLQADVPVGAFLSGGFDSSVISLLAKRHHQKIPAFTIGFPDQPFYDESKSAREMAKHLHLDHHVIELREQQIEEKLEAILNAIDEPFADSSAVLVNILSEYTASEVKVALSGDGADEIMGGYNKHRALLRSLNKGLINRGLKSTAGALKSMPESRNSGSLNQLRKIKRYSKGLNMSYAERYEAWASFTQAKTAKDLLRNPVDKPVLDVNLDESDFNSVLKADLSLVLPNDMLHKTDLMSMHHSLEVRVPFLDHHLVDFLFEVPASQKLNKNRGKLILREAFKDDFPSGFFDRGKKGFEAPLSNWLKGPLKGMRERCLNRKFVESQGLFKPDALMQLEHKALGRYPGDSVHTLWAVLVFQHWWGKMFFSH
jgi:asparagine synthase (glutamine-hydrolysing)